MLKGAVIFCPARVNIEREKHKISTKTITRGRLTLKYAYLSGLLALIEAEQAWSENNLFVCFE